MNIDSLDFVFFAYYIHTLLCTNKYYNQETVFIVSAMTVAFIIFKSSKLMYLNYKSRSIHLPFATLFKCFFRSNFKTIIWQPHKMAQNMSYSEVCYKQE